MNSFAMFLDSPDRLQIVLAVVSLLVVGGCLSAVSRIARYLLSRATASVQVLLGRVTVLCLLAVPVVVFVSPAFPFVEFSRPRDDATPSQSPISNNARAADAGPSISNDQIADGEPNQQAMQRAPLATFAELKLAGTLSSPNSHSSAFWLNLAVAVWALAGLCMFVRLLTSHFVVWQFWRLSKGVSPAVQRIVDASFSDKLRSSRVTIRQSRNINVPVCVGIVRRRVLLPWNVEDWSTQYHNNTGGHIHFGRWAGDTFTGVPNKTATYKLTSLRVTKLDPNAGINSVKQTAIETCREWVAENLDLADRELDDFHSTIYWNTNSSDEEFRYVQFAHKTNMAKIIHPQGIEMIKGGFPDYFSIDVSRDGKVVLSHYAAGE